MTCGTCNKALTVQTVATKTRKQGKHTIVLASKQALVCAEHGVVCLDPPRATTIIQQPAILPAPYVPARPLNPPWYPQQPWSTMPNTLRPTTITWTNATSGTVQ